MTGHDLYDAVVDYVLATSGLPGPVVHRVLTRRLTNPAMKKKFASTLEQTRTEGRTAGIAEGKTAGIAEGKAAGIAEGKADTLLRQITRRFGAPEAAVVARLRAAAPAQLDRWAERILDAATLDELFAG